MIPLLDLRAQMLPLREELQEALTRLLDSTQFIGGSALEAFEKDFGRYLGASHALGCSNGTEAVTLALQACGVKPGDRIVTVSMTFIATAEAIRDAGCEFAFVDVDPETDVMTGEILERFLSAEKKEGITYAGVIPVHLRGNPCNMRDILDVAKKYDLFVIEDAAQAHGATLDGKMTGNFGRAATFSFFPGKNLGALGDAGAVVTNDENVAMQAKLLRDHGRQGKYEHVLLGHNYRMDAVQAAWLQVKLRHLDVWNRRRQAIAEKYKQLLGNVKGIQLPRVTAGATHVYHLYSIRCANRDRLAELLKKEGIMSGVHYPRPLHDQPAFKSVPYRKGPLVNSEKICRETLSLPIDPNLADAEIERIAGIVRAFAES